MEAMTMVNRTRAQRNAGGPETSEDPEDATRFRCDLSNPAASPFLHAWEHTVGSGHATLALRADWQRQLTQCHRELGFRHVRFHGLLCDDVGTLMCEDDALVYSFFNADQICDFLLSIGMRPFVELSFMPTALSSGKNTVFHYGANVTPPKDYTAWATLIGKLVGHWVERFGLAEVAEWPFEVWNEPNLASFWTGSQADYFRLYACTARAIKDVHESLRVGGPATADNQWIDELLAYCDSHGTPIDFVSTHHYPTDAFGKPGDDTLAQLAQSRRSALRDEAAKARDQARGKPLYYTEWATSSNPFDALHDQPYAAAFIAKTVMESHSLVDGYSYWTFTDIFEENYFSSVPFHGGFGLLTIHGVPKPAYRAFEMLHRLGDEILKVDGHHATLDVWVTRSGRQVQVLVTNGALARHPIGTETVRLELKGTGEIRSAHVERIDDDHANARRAWTEMGRPESLLPRQVDALIEASLLVKEPVPVAHETPEAVVFCLTLPPQGTALLTLELA
jgi:xylan 1,4-beta-xylosidase